MAISIIDINVKNLIPNPNNPRKDVGDVTEFGGVQVGWFGVCAVCGA